MDGIPFLGRFLILTGLSLALLGVFLTLGSQHPSSGKLPGDIVIHRDNTTFIFPLGTSLLLSVILTFIFTILRQ